MKNPKVIILAVVATLLVGIAITLAVSEPIRTGLIDTLRGTADDTVDMVTPNENPDPSTDDETQTSEEPNNTGDSEGTTDSETTETNPNATPDANTNPNSEMGQDDVAAVDGTKQETTFREDDNLKIYVPNTKGTSVLLVDGQDAMLVDTGAASDAPAILAMMKKQNVTHLKYLVISNWHPETAGGVKEILNNVKAQYIILSGNLMWNEKGKPVIKYLKNKRLVWAIPSNSGGMALGKSSVRVLSSNKGGSLLTHVNNGLTNVAISGSTTYFEDVIFKYLPTNIDLYIVTHNGPHYKVPTALLDKLNPKTILLNNESTIPSNESIKELTRPNTKLYQSQESGNISIGSNGVDLNFMINTK